MILYLTGNCRPLCIVQRVFSLAGAASQVVKSAVSYHRDG